MESYATRGGDGVIKIETTDELEPPAVSKAGELMLPLDCPWDCSRALSLPNGFWPLKNPDGLPGVQKPGARETQVGV